MIVYLKADFGRKENEAGKVAPAASGENGPIEEADVYIAYKRYDQAAKVLQAAAAKNPGDSQVQLKLLEVAGESADKPLFDKTAAALLALGVPAIAAQVNRLTADYESTFDDEGLSLDDLENQLLTGKLPEQKAIAEDLDIDDVLCRRPIWSGVIRWAPLMKSPTIIWISILTWRYRGG
ncbi:MAG: hypothetical protein IPM37_07655 [Hahellaceae bacterium]|nr:hypothetical protein [Hahellaceae bacterium]